FPAAPSMSSTFLSRLLRRSCSLKSPRNTPVTKTIF
ncbi:uncharacterized protein METZ01_LOCUS310699, partial [marine metagenome]